jgi:hypothetical protein
MPEYQLTHIGKMMARESANEKNVQVHPAVGCGSLAIALTFLPECAPHHAIVRIIADQAIVSAATQRPNLDWKRDPTPQSPRSQTVKGAAGDYPFSHLAIKILGYLTKE